MLATSDLPGGVVNILTGSAAEMAPWLAGHMDVNGLDLTGADAELAQKCEELAAENLKRVLRPNGKTGLGGDPGHPADDGVPGDQDGLAPERDLTGLKRRCRVPTGELHRRSIRNRATA